jgi:hypothetical protein
MLVCLDRIIAVCWGRINQILLYYHSWGEGIVLQTRPIVVVFFVLFVAVSFDCNYEDQGRILWGILGSSRVSLRLAISLPNLMPCRWPMLSWPIS